MAPWRNTPKRYGRISQCLHWLMAFGILFMIALGYLVDEFPGMSKADAIALHKSIGITILALAVLRLGWRFANQQPALPPTLTKFKGVAAKVAHWLLYGLMVAMPVSGWLMVSGFGKSIVLFGVLPIPALLEKDRAVGAFWKDVHESLVYGLIAVILLHVAAAMYHHFILKDDVLKRMLPIFRKDVPKADAPIIG
jgi:cytochrome b561